MIVKRSNHIPTLTRIEAMNITGMLRRSRLTQKICGTSTLHETMIQ